MTDWIWPFKVILYNDDGSVVGETGAQTEEEGLAFIETALTEAMNESPDVDPSDAGRSVPSTGQDPSR